MKTVHKFIAKVAGDPMVLHIPVTARVVHFGLQNNQRCVWIELDTDAPKVNRVFEIFGTGWDIDGMAGHCGTLVDPSGFVWHLYEYAETPDGQPN